MHACFARSALLPGERSQHEEEMQRLKRRMDDLLEENNRLLRASAGGVAGVAEDRLCRTRYHIMAFRIRACDS